VRRENRPCEGGIAGPRVNWKRNWELENEKRSATELSAEELSQAIATRGYLAECCKTGNQRQSRATTQLAEGQIIEIPASALQQDRPACNDV
jgi:hypothetical protein